MAFRSGSPLRLRAALWAERRLPVLARPLQRRPVLPGEAAPHGTVYRGAEGGPLLVVVGERGSEPHWLGSVLAAGLGAVSVVVPGDPATAGDELRTAIAEVDGLGADPERIAMVGVGAGAPTALLTVADPHGAEIRRLVLLAPTDAPRSEWGRVPPTFLQSSPQSATLAASRALEIDLREAGVAVRPVEYAGLPDAWMRYPGYVPGSKRAVEDILAFLRRGFGTDGTFSGVIPGWDLR